MKTVVYINGNTNNVKLAKRKNAVKSGDFIGFYDFVWRFFFSGKRYLWRFLDKIVFNFPTLLIRDLSEEIYFGQYI